MSLGTGGKRKKETTGSGTTALVSDFTRGIVIMTCPCVNHET